MEVCTPWLDIARIVELDIANRNSESLNIGKVSDYAGLSRVSEKDEGRGLLNFT